MNSKFSKNPYFRQPEMFRRRKGGREEVRNGECGVRSEKPELPEVVECPVCGGTSRHDPECPLYGKRVAG
jgi:hypothetical protein